MQSLLKSLIIFELVICIQSFLPYSEYIQGIEKILPKTHISSECKEDIHTYFSQTTNFSLWALQMLVIDENVTWYKYVESSSSNASVTQATDEISVYDATGKLPSGILEGNIYSLGHFDQCLKIKSPDNKIQGQYCLATFQMEVDDSPWKQYHDEFTMGRGKFEINHKRKGPMIFSSTTFHQWGVCIPASCSHLDIQTLLTTLSFNWSPKVSINVMVPEDACSIAKSFQLSPLEMLLVSPLIMIVLLVIWSSIRYSTQEQSKTLSLQNNWQRIFQSFSIQNNWKELFIEQRDSISSLDGIRALSIFWVVLTHRIIIYFLIPSLNKVDLVERSRSIYNSWLINTSICTDSYLLLGGFLRGIGITKQYEKKENRSFWNDLKSRYLRLAPAYFITIIVHSVIMPQIGNGPAWDLLWQEEKRRCEQSWLFNVLFLNIFINYDKFCMVQSWYISADMHLFLLAPLLIYPLFKWPRLGKIILSTGVLLLGILLPFTLTYWLDLPGMLFFNAHDEKIYGFVRWIYMNPFCRIFPYCLGLIFGYWFYYKKNNQIQISKPFLIIGWIIGLGCLNLAVISGNRFMQKDYKFDILESSLFTGLHRAIWSIGVAWLIFACHFGIGGPIAKFFSAQFWKPLSRISFCIFLTHMFVLLYNSLSLRCSHYIDEIALIHNYLGELAFIIPIALMFYLLVEAPFVKIIRILTSKVSTVQDKIPIDKTKCLSSQENSNNYENTISLTPEIVRRKRED